MSNRRYRTASDIYRAIVNDAAIEGYTVIIIGRSGPTGKSTLCKLLVGAGIKAIDISESLDNHIEYLDPYKNDVTVDHDNRTVLVVLNRTRVMFEE